MQMGLYSKALSYDYGFVAIKILQWILWSKIDLSIKHGVCNEHGTIYAISSDFGNRMTTQHLD